METNQKQLNPIDEILSVNFNPSQIQTFRLLPLIK